jgi:hypothetical protein
MKRPRSIATDDIALATGTPESDSRRFAEYQPNETELPNSFGYKTQAQSPPEGDSLRVVEQSEPPCQRFDDVGKACKCDDQNHSPGEVLCVLEEYAGACPFNEINKQGGT